MASTRLYVDSSVWNAAFDEHVPEMHALTHEFLNRLAVETWAEALVSDVVLQELAGAPKQRLEQLGQLLTRIAPTRLDFDEEAATLADAYIQHGVLSVGHLEDAKHVAVATVAEVDALVSWNYRHLVNRRRREAFNGVNAILGYRPIDIVSPPEVFDE